MAIPYSCPACGHQGRAKDELAGRKVKCKACGTPLRLPRAGGTPAAGQSPAGQNPARLVQPASAADPFGSVTDAKPVDPNDPFAGVASDPFQPLPQAAPTPDAPSPQASPTRGRGQGEGRGAIGAGFEGFDEALSARQADPDEYDPRRPSSEEIANIPIGTYRGTFIANLDDLDAVDADELVEQDAQPAPPARPEAGSRPAPPPPAQGASSPQPARADATSPAERARSANEASPEERAREAAQFELGDILPELDGADFDPEPEPAATPGRRPVEAGPADPAPTASPAGTDFDAFAAQQQREEEKTAAPAPGVKEPPPGLRTQAMRIFRQSTDGNVYQDGDPTTGAATADDPPAAPSAPTAPTSPTGGATSAASSPSGRRYAGRPERAAGGGPKAPAGHIPGRKAQLAGARVAKTEPGPGEIACANCGGIVSERAKVCRHCGFDLSFAHLLTGEAAGLDINVVREQERIEREEAANKRRRSIFRIVGGALLVASFFLPWVVGLNGTLIGGETTNGSSTLSGMELPTALLAGLQNPDPSNGSGWTSESGATGAPAAGASGATTGSSGSGEASGNDASMTSGGATNSEATSGASSPQERSLPPLLDGRNRVDTDQMIALIALFAVPLFGLVTLLHESLRGGTSVIVGVLPLLGLGQWFLFLSLDPSWLGLGFFLAAGGAVLTLIPPIGRSSSSASAASS
mgnify:CR=1 FL=1